LLQRYIIVTLYFTTAGSSKLAM